MRPARIRQWGTAHGPTRGIWRFVHAADRYAMYTTSPTGVLTPDAQRSVPALAARCPARVAVLDAATGLVRWCADADAAWDLSPECSDSDAEPLASPLSPGDDPAESLRPLGQLAIPAEALDAARFQALLRVTSADWIHVVVSAARAVRVFLVEVGAAFELQPPTGRLASLDHSGYSVDDTQSVPHELYGCSAFLALKCDLPDDGATPRRIVCVPPPSAMGTLLQLPSAADAATSGARTERLVVLREHPHRRHLVGDTLHARLCLIILKLRHHTGAVEAPWGAPGAAACLQLLRQCRGNQLLAPAPLRAYRVLLSDVARHHPSLALAARLNARLHNDTLAHRVAVAQQPSAPSQADTGVGGTVPAAQAEAAVHGASPYYLDGVPADDSALREALCDLRHSNGVPPRLLPLAEEWGTPSAPRPQLTPLWVLQLRCAPAAASAFCDAAAAVRDMLAAQRTRFASLADGLLVAGDPPRTDEVRALVVQLRDAAAVSDVTVGAQMTTAVADSAAALGALRTTALRPDAAERLAATLRPEDVDVPRATVLTAFAALHASVAAACPSHALAAALGHVTALGAVDLVAATATQSRAASQAARRSAAVDSMSALPRAVPGCSPRVLHAMLGAAADYTELVVLRDATLHLRHVLQRRPSTASGEAALVRDVRREVQSPRAAIAASHPWLLPLEAEQRLRIRREQLAACRRVFAGVEGATVLDASSDSDAGAPSSDDDNAEAADQRHGSAAAAPAGVVHRLAMGEGKTHVVLPMIALEARARACHRGGTATTPHNMDCDAAMPPVKLEPGCAPTADTAEPTAAWMPVAYVPPAVLREVQARLATSLTALPGAAVPIVELPCTRAALPAPASSVALASIADAARTRVASRCLVLTTASAAQSRSLKRDELVLADPDDAVSARAAAKALSLGRLMGGVPKHRQLHVVDEADAVLAPATRVIYAVGAPRGDAHCRLRWAASELLLACVAHAEAAYAFADSGDAADVANNAGRPHSAIVFPRGRRLPKRRALPGADATTAATDGGLPTATHEARHALLVEAVHRAGDTGPLPYLRSLSDPAARRRVHGVIVDGTRPIAAHDSHPEVLCLRGLLGYGVLEHALSLRHLVDYGAPAAGEGTGPALAVPYECADTPRPRADFEHPDLAVVLTYLAALHDGLRRDDVRSVASALQAMPAGRRDAEYAAIVAGLDAQERALMPAATAFDADSDAEVALLHARLGRCFGLVGAYLRLIVFPRCARTHEGSLVSSASHLVSRLPRWAGFSGTIGNNAVWPLRAAPAAIDADAAQRDTDVMAALATDASAVQALLATAQPPCVLPANEAEGVLRLAAADGGIWALIDGGGVLAGWPAHAVAARLLALLHQRRARRDPHAFASEDRHGVCISVDGAWVVYDLAHRARCLPLADSPVRPEQCLVVFDQARCRGADVRCRGDACAIVTVGPGVGKDALLQAAARLRGLGSGQRVQLAMTAEVHRDVVAVTRGAAQPITTSSQASSTTGSQQLSQRPTRTVFRRAPACAVTTADVLVWAVANDTASALRQLPVMCRHEGDVARAAQHAATGALLPRVQPAHSTLASLYGPQTEAALDAQQRVCSWFQPAPVPDELTRRLAATGVLTGPGAVLLSQPDNDPAGDRAFAGWCERELHVEAQAPEAGRRATALQPPAIEEPCNMDSYTQGDCAAWAALPRTPFGRACSRVHVTAAFNATTDLRAKPGNAAHAAARATLFRAPRRDPLQEQRDGEYPRRVRAALHHAASDTLVLLTELQHAVVARDWMDRLGPGVRLVRLADVRRTQADGSGFGEGVTAMRIANADSSYGGVRDTRVLRALTWHWDVGEGDPPRVVAAHGVVQLYEGSDLAAVVQRHADADATGRRRGRGDAEVALPASAPRPAQPGK